MIIIILLCYNRKNIKITSKRRIDFFDLLLNLLDILTTINSSKLLIPAVTDIASSLDAKLTLYRFGNRPNAMSIGLKEKDLNAMLLDTPATAPGVQEKSGHQDKLLYIYTSGTTGLPKAAVITNSR